MILSALLGTKLAEIAGQIARDPHSGEDWYTRYIRSPRWHRRRDAIIESRGVCENCGSRERLQVHHLTYSRLGHEADADLVLLCRQCHGDRHPGRTRHS
jgi:5-methylcytosine-specific restriction endonuclease McrA